MFRPPSRLAVVGAPFLVGLFAVCIGGCEGDVPDAGGEPEPTPIIDAGTLDAGTLDAGPIVVDAGFDAGPPPPEETAQRLCLAFVRGEAQVAADAAFRVNARCSAADSLPNVADLPDADVVDVSRCLPGRSEHQLFLAGLVGGRVEFDLDAIEACAQSGKTARRTHATLGSQSDRQAALAAALAACTGTVTPLAAEGELCTQAWDCPAQTPCQADPRDSQSFACLAPAAEGETCLDDTLVSVDGFTRTALRTCEAGLQCFAEVCTARLVLGAYCDATTAQCEAALVCGPGNFCVAPIAEGQTCSESQQCEPGLQCSLQPLEPDAGPVLNRLCQVPPDDNRIPDGQTCTPGDQCQELCSVCRPDAPLGPAFSCQDRGAAGGACSATTDCRQGLYCSPDGTCAALRAVTESCDGNNPCADTLFCNATVSACQLRPTLGNPCSPFGPDLCAEGFCTNNVCVAGVGGDPCGNDNTCADSFLCVNAPQPDVDGGPQPPNRSCVATPREGAPCTLDGRCVTSAFCDGERCRAFPGPGETCRNGNCAPGSFCNGDTPESTCELARPPSSLCVDDNQCSSTVCLDTGTCAALGPRANTTGSLLAQYVLLSLVPFGLFPLAIAFRRRRRDANRLGGVR